MSVRKPIGIGRSIPVPSAFRGNCECGRWLIVPIAVPESDPIRCECGRSYWWDGDLCHRTIHPLIFLDIDGVLINTQTRTKPCNYAIARLNHFAKKRRAVIVVSSSWRKAGLESITRQLAEWGVKIPIVDITPDLSHREESGVWRAVQRGHEIWKWLVDNKRQDCNMVILDDETDMATVRQWLIKTDYKFGLTDANAMMALEMLSDPVSD